MSVVYITESNFNKIAQDVGDAIANTKSLESLYHHEFRSILAIPELKRLSSIKLILESMSNEDVFISIIKFNRHALLRGKKDSKERWIYLGGSPAYHKTNKCSRLTSEYKNYDIPLSIPENRIEEYRKFFIENMEIYERDISTFYMHAELKFHVVIENIQKVQAKNSGIEEVNNFKYSTSDELIFAINNHINRMLAYRKSDQQVDKTIARFGFNTAKAIANKDKLRLTHEQVKIVETWHKDKSDLKRLVIKHLTVKLNPDFSFDGELLDSFGFRKCADCFGNNHNIH
ncbi:hypothetical protein CWN98_01540 [Vibrio splendidus]|uniref:hypothetical protein n=1 Tax=Vibrio splendidus TaxID=29497 RepID=UPI000D38D72F|nr:hypothetical protein [Vibrio splendidus]PTO90160.1 hypothetical protein CWN98_01540 [Vibrio splendidus]PTP50447.1 hypothetical protein CWO10_02875 [Vibrio splendidus]